MAPVKPPAALSAFQEQVIYCVAGVPEPQIAAVLFLQPLLLSIWMGQNVWKYASSTWDSRGIFIKKALVHVVRHTFRTASKAFGALRFSIYRVTFDLVSLAFGACCIVSMRLACRCRVILTRSYPGYALLGIGTLPMLVVNVFTWSFLLRHV